MGMGVTMDNELEWFDNETFWDDDNGEYCDECERPLSRCLCSFDYDDDDYDDDYDGEQ